MKRKEEEEEVRRGMTSSVTKSNMDAQTNSFGSARAERKEREKQKIIQREKQRHTVKTV